MVYVGIEVSIILPISCIKLFLCTVASSNYRMPEMAAAIGITQIKRADEFVNKRNLLADRYAERLKETDIVRYQDIYGRVK